MLPAIALTGKAHKTSAALGEPFVQPLSGFDIILGDVIEDNRAIVASQCSPDNR